MIGEAQLGHLSRDGKHINVSLKKVGRPYNSSISAFDNKEILAF